MATYSSLASLKSAVSGYSEFHVARMKRGEAVNGPDQRGPCCGLYALQHVYNYWARNGVPEFANAPVVARKGARMHEGPGPAPTSSLRQYAKQHGLTQIGELLSAEALRQVALGTGMFDATLVPFGNQADFEQQVTENLIANCPLILGFDVDGETGSPALKGGASAHWTTLIGYAKRTNGALMIAHFHWGEYHLDSAASFFQSNWQLRLILAGNQRWVKHKGVGKEDSLYFDKHSSKAAKYNAQANPVIGNFSRPDLRDVAGLVGHFVRLKPRHFDQSDLELVGVVQLACDRYAQSLKGFFGLFRNPSEGSLSALRQLRTMIDLQCSLPTKCHDLRNMVRHFRKDPKTTQRHTTWGEAAGTTFRKYLNEAFAGREHLLA